MRLYRLCLEQHPYIVFLQSIALKRCLNRFNTLIAADNHLSNTLFSGSALVVYIWLSLLISSLIAGRSAFRKRSRVSDAPTSRRTSIYNIQHVRSRFAQGSRLYSNMDSLTLN